MTDKGTTTQVINSTNESKSITYTVQSEDTLWKIATENGTTVQKIKSLNNLTSDVIHIGQTLKLSKEAILLSPSESSTFNEDAVISEAKKYRGFFMYGVDPYHQDLLVLGS